MMKFESEISTQLRKDGATFVMEGLRSSEKGILLIESQLEDLKITQEISLDEINKY